MPPKGKSWRNSSTEDGYEMTDFENDLDYEECLVTFFDVLGFRNLLHTRSGAEIRDLLSMFRRVSERNATPPTRSDEMRMISEVHAEIVSDAIVRTRTIGTQYQAGLLVWELIDLLHIQIECVANGKLVRGAMTRSRPSTFSNRHGQELISLRFILRAGLFGSLRGHRMGRRMFAFRVGRIEVVCAVFAAVVGAISPSPCVPAGRIPFR